MPKSKKLGFCNAGFEVLTAMEKVRTDDDDRPKQEIKITGATVFVNPYKDEEEAERKAAEEARLKVTPQRWPELALRQGLVKAGWIRLKQGNLLCCMPIVTAGRQGSCQPMQEGSKDQTKVIEKGHLARPCLPSGRSPIFCSI